MQALSSSEAVVAEARSWLGTPYHHRAAVKGPHGGVDCLRLLAEVYHAAGVIPFVEIPSYSPDWHLHRDEERYLHGIMRYAYKLEDGQEEPADIAIFSFGRTASHGGIYIGDDQMIHAFRNAGNVCISEIRRSPMLGTRLRGFYRIGVAP